MIRVRGVPSGRPASLIALPVQFSAISLCGGGKVLAIRRNEVLYETLPEP